MKGIKPTKKVFRLIWPIITGLLVLIIFDFYKQEAPKTEASHLIDGYKETSKQGRQSLTEELKQDNPTVPIPPNLNQDKTRKITAVGMGFPPENVNNPSQARQLAKRAAEVIALRNLTEKVKGAILEASTIVKNSTLTEDEISLKVQNLVKGAKMVSEKANPDDSVEVEMEILLEEKQQY